MADARKIRVELCHRTNLLCHFTLDKLCCADLAVAEVERRARLLEPPCRLIGHIGIGGFRRLTEESWADALATARPGEDDSIDSLQLNILLEEQLEEETDQPGKVKWEVQTNSGWRMFKPGKRFKGEPGEEFVFWRDERRYRVSFLTPYEGNQVNLTTLRNRPLRRVVEEYMEQCATNLQEGVYKIALAGGDNPKTTFEQLGWELCAHRVQPTDKRDDTSTYAMFHKPAEGKSSRTCNHFRLEHSKTYPGRYNFRLHGGDNPGNTYEQAGWSLCLSSLLGKDVRNSDSSFACLQETSTEGSSFAGFELRKVGGAYKIVAAGESEEKVGHGWELCTHRALGKDQRSKVSTYAIFHSTGENRTCNHFHLHRVNMPGGKLPTATAESSSAASANVGRSICGMDGQLWGQVVADEGSAWKLEGGRIAKKHTEGTRWCWQQPKAELGSEGPTPVPPASLNDQLHAERCPAPSASMMEVGESSPVGFQMVPATIQAETCGPQVAQDDDEWQVLAD